MSEQQRQERDYRDTVFLPKTDFPMKAGLPQKEPEILARWQADGLYQQLREARAGREKFILHDGPPYANGDMHIGHALNHVLKDMVVRTQSLLGKDAPYVPGWDCHGLPIEWKVEEQYRKKKLNKDEVPAKEFRAECRAYAQQWVDVQREQLKRLGINGDWDNPYLTMQFDSEATIVRELLKFAESGQLYRGAKPVMWSPVEKTALAEAEVEYEDITSTQIDVAFEIKATRERDLLGAHLVVWTTTPWTIPANQAVAYGPEIDYILLELTRIEFIPVTERGAPTPIRDNSKDKRVLVAANLVDDFKKRLNPPQGMLHWMIQETGIRIKGADLEGTVVAHPMHKLGGFYAEERPLLPGDFVTTDSGTGLVHMAPDHGEDDFDLCKANGIGPKFVVEADGRYREDWAWLPRTDERSMSVINPKFNAPDGPVCSDLREVGALLSASADYKHSYPHSWRSKAKVIYRCTPQWFVPMDRRTLEHPDNRQEQRWENEGGSQEPLKTLRELATDALEATKFYPGKGRNRIGSMVAGRPDWVLSRQRAWGVPISVFFDKDTGEVLKDDAVNARIAEAFEAEGADAWYKEGARERFLAGVADAERYEMVTDILDVWFDSGSTHAFVLENKAKWPEVKWPASIYLEGSDQHRGFFQSSLLESCGTRGRAPYDAVLTHGFTMDADGRKMSKSLGNVVAPQDIIKQYGADILRLWTASVDYSEDQRLGKEIIQTTVESYRKLRNTLRWLLGNLAHYKPEEAVPFEQMPELERLMLHRLAGLDHVVREAYAQFDYKKVVAALTNFMNIELSAFYFDIRKDALYCDPISSLKRRAALTVLDHLYTALVTWLAPILVFTMEEVWLERHKEEGASVHRQLFPTIPAQWQDDKLAEKWRKIRAVRRVVTGALEIERREKRIGSSLEASPKVYVADADLYVALHGQDFAEISITSDIELVQNEGPAEAFRLDDVPGVSVVPAPAQGQRCARSWKILPSVGSDVQFPDLTPRDAQAMRERAAAGL